MYISYAFDFAIAIAFAVCSHKPRAEKEWKIVISVCFSAEFLFFFVCIREMHSFYHFGLICMCKVCLCVGEHLLLLFFSHIFRKNQQKEEWFASAQLFTGWKSFLKFSIDRLLNSMILYIFYVKTKVERRKTQKKGRNNTLREKKSTNRSERKLK